jgi:diguanylate cyclase (GGDEF)-like protein/PAS domain S-box-containing protein
MSEIRNKILNLRDLFVAGFAQNEVSGEEDPGYRWLWVWFRWAITAAYLFIALGLRPGQAPGWVAITIGFLVTYHAGYTADVITHNRRGHPVRWFFEAVPFFDIVVISLIMASVPSLSFPVWGVYVLVVFGASLSRLGSYVFTLTLSSLIGYGFALAVHLAAGQSVSWTNVIVVNIVLAFSGWWAANRAWWELQLFGRLKEATQRFKTVIESSPVAIAALDRELKVTMWNPAAATTFGWVEEEVIGQPYPLVPAEGETEFAELRDRVFGGEGFTGVEVQRHRRDGSLIDVSVATSPLRDAEGSVTGVLAMLSDISERKGAEAALRGSEERYRALFENNPQPMLVYDAGTLGILAANDALVTQYGYSSPELLSMTIKDMLPAEDLPALLENLSRPAPALEHAGEWRNRKKNGAIIDVEITSHAVEFEGCPARLVLASDITDRKRAEDALRKAEDLYRTLASHAPVGIFMTDAGGDCTFVNERWCEFAGLTPEQARGPDWAAALHPDDRERVFREWYESAQEGREFKSEYRFQTPDGKVTWVTGSAVPLFGDDGEVTGHIGTVTNVTEQKQAEDTIRHLAYHDALTGLPNRLLLEDRLNVAIAQARRSGQPLLVASMDVDRLKVVNDTLGHATGDKLLGAVAQRLRKVVRDGDTIARVGGDEFILLFPGGAHAQDAGVIGAKILDVFRRPFLLDAQEVNVTTSVGFSVYPSDGDDGETLLRNADAAMYKAKKQRNGFQLYKPSMNSQAAARLSLENDLRHAVSRRELVLHYQPQADVASGRIVGVEALIRWQHPQLGLIPPDRFIPLAEETGLIVPIGEWVLRAACSQARDWIDAGVNGLRLAVNLSARQFLESGLEEMVGRTLTQSRFIPNRLELEITESTAMDDVETTARVLDALRGIGVRIAIDDFGTGHSSLSYLKNFPINTLKIDRSFVKDIPGDGNDSAITSAAIALAHSLGLEVVAEGVETEEQLSFLRDRACDNYQGYLLSKPVAPGELTADLVRLSRIASADKA